MMFLKTRYHLQIMIIQCGGITDKIQFVSASEKILLSADGISRPIKSEIRNFLQK